MTAIIPASQTEIIPARDIPDLTALLSGTVSASTAEVYKGDARAYSAWAKAQGLDPLHPATFGAWRSHLVTATDYSPRTINRMLSAVRKLIDEAATQGIVPEAVAASFARIGGVKVSAMVSRTKRNARVRIPPEKMRAIIEAPDTSTLKGLRDRAFLLLLATSGLRVSEAINLTVDDLTERPDGQGVEVLGKNRSERHFAPMSREAWNAIWAWLKARPVQSPYVFTSAQGRGGRWTDKPMSKVAAWKMVRAYAAQVGVQDIKPHDFRRFVGTQLVERHGVATAQAVLGHKNAATTLDNYVISDVRGNVTEGLF